MLNRAKVLQELQSISGALFFDISPELEVAREVWGRICKDVTFRFKVAQAQSPWLIPIWHGKLDEVISGAAFTDPYTVVAVDGSQIYPDRHQGTSCYLINVGTVVLNYQLGQHPVKFDSIPYVFLPTEEDVQTGSTDLVNCKRQDYEFIAGVQLMEQLKNALHGFDSAESLAHHERKSINVIKMNNEPVRPERAEASRMDSNYNSLFLFDGSLIFWHLEGKDEVVKNEYISKYVSALYQLYKQQALIAGYISAPKSKELVNLIRLQLSDFNPEKNDGYKKVEHLVDSHIASFILEPLQRTAVFASSSNIIQFYPEPLKPYFFYLNLGQEIVRIEVPQWIAMDADKVNRITSIIIDQSIKGFGYPVCLAEAHEQAVVKGPDREFFYHMIQKLGFEGNRRMAHSQKSIKKRGIGI